MHHHTAVDNSEQNGNFVLAHRDSHTLTGSRVTVFIVVVECDPTMNRAPNKSSKHELLKTLK